MCVCTPAPRAQECTKRVRPFSLLGNVLLSPAKYGHSEDLRNNAQGSFQLTAIDFEYASYNNR